MMGRQWRNRHRPACGRTITGMGRGSQSHTANQLTATRHESALERTVVERLRGWGSIRIASGGRLSVPEAGHPAGTPYLVIEADDATSRDIARTLLGDCCGTTELAWEYGWRGRFLDDGRRVTEL